MSMSNTGRMPSPLRPTPALRTATRILASPPALSPEPRTIPPMRARELLTTQPMRVPGRTVPRRTDPTGKSSRLRPVAIRIARTA
jgi:hypothetical protein